MENQMLYINKNIFFNFSEVRKIAILFLKTNYPPSIKTIRSKIRYPWNTCKFAK